MAVSRLVTFGGVADNLWVGFSAVASDGFDVLLLVLLFQQKEGVKAGLVNSVLGGEKHRQERRSRELLC